MADPSSGGVEARQSEAWRIGVATMWRRGGSESWRHGGTAGQSHGNAEVWQVKVAMIRRCTVSDSRR
jgi:hypothetical protein